jgi:hypothetical protein
MPRDFWFDVTGQGFSSSCGFAAAMVCDWRILAQALDFVIQVIYITLGMP